MPFAPLPQPATGVRPLRFDADLAAVPAVPPAADWRARALAAEAELAALAATHADAVAAAHAEGRSAGEAAMLDDGRMMAATSLDQIAATMAELDAAMAAQTGAITAAAADLALAAAAALAGRAVAEQPAGAIAAAIAAAADQVARGTMLRVTVHPDLIAPLTTLIDAHDGTGGGADRRRLAIQICPDPEVAAGDARIDWDGGDLAATAAHRRAALAGALAGLDLGFAPGLGGGAVFAAPGGGAMFAAPGGGADPALSSGGDSANFSAPDAAAPNGPS